MTWEYRIVKELDGDYSVREVFNEHSWTVDGVSPFGSTRDEMRQSFTNYIEALHKPILVVNDGVVVDREEPLVKLSEKEIVDKPVDK
jgi:hypothetical protein